MSLQSIFPLLGQPALQKSPTLVPKIFKGFLILFSLALKAFPLQVPAYIPAEFITNPNASSAEVSVDPVHREGTDGSQCFPKESQVMLLPCEFTVIWGLPLVFRLTNWILPALQMQALPRIALK